MMGKYYEEDNKIIHFAGEQRGSAEGRRHFLLGGGLTLFLTFPRRASLRPDYDARSNLHLTASEGHVEATKWLLRHGVEVNAMDRWGNTPLQVGWDGGFRKH